MSGSHHYSQPLPETCCFHEMTWSSPQLLDFIKPTSSYIHMYFLIEPCFDVAGLEAVRYSATWLSLTLCSQSIDHSSIFPLLIHLATLDLTSRMEGVTWGCRICGQDFSLVYKVSPSIMSPDVGCLVLGSLLTLMSTLATSSTCLASAGGSSPEIYHPSTLLAVVVYFMV